MPNLGSVLAAKFKYSFVVFTSAVESQPRALHMLREHLTTKRTNSTFKCSLNSVLGRECSRRIYGVLRTWLAVPGI